MLANWRNLFDQFQGLGHLMPMSFVLVLTAAPLHPCRGSDQNAARGQRAIDEPGAGAWISDVAQEAGQPQEPEATEEAETSEAVQPEAPDQKSEEQAPAAVVIEVAGTVDWAKPGVSPLAKEGWTAVKIDDRLEPGTLIRTGLRSHVHLQCGETTAIAVRSVTFASIDQFFKSATTERVRIGLGYGTVRGGSSEGEIRADVMVDSPVATLAKRGTEGWQMDVEPATGRFKISLSQFGLVEATQIADGQVGKSRLVRPGEYATGANIANTWLRQDIFDRNLWFYQAEGLSLDEAEFTADNRRGYAVLAPGGGTEIYDLSERNNAAFVLPRTIGGDSPQPPNLFPPAGPVDRPEGNFGTPDSFKSTLLFVRGASGKGRFLTGRPEIIRGTPRIRK